MTILIIDNNDDSINDDDVDDDDDGYLCELLLIFLRANLIPYADNSLFNLTIIIFMLRM
jgi:hypothetical protein